MTIYHIFKGKLSEASRIQGQLDIDQGTPVNGLSVISPLRIINLIWGAQDNDTFIFHQHAMGVNILIAYAFSKIANKRIRIIFDIHDCILEENKFHSSKYYTAYIVSVITEWVCLRISIDLVTVSPGLVRHLFQKSGRKAFLYLSIPGGGRLVNTAASRHDEKFVYFGAINNERLPCAFLDKFGATKRLLHIYGFLGIDEFYNQRFRQACLKYGYEYKGMYAGCEIINKLFDYCASVLIYDTYSYNIRHCLPNKLFQGFSICLPCIAPRELVDIWELFGSLGIVYEPDQFVKVKTFTRGNEDWAGYFAFAQGNSKKYRDYIIKHDLKQNAVLIV